MARISSNNIISAIDIGTTKICVLVAHVYQDDNIEVIGIGKYPSYGLSKGVVVDIGKTVHSITSAVKEAELMAGMTINSASIGIAGSHIRSLNSDGVVPIPKQEIRQADVDCVLAAAQAIPVNDGEKILHVLPRYFLIDDREKVENPIGMHGVRLAVKAHVILGSISSVKDLLSCCQQVGLTVTDVVLESIASADAVLSDDERKLGVGLLDIGGGTSDLALYYNGGICYTTVLPVAGNHITNDIAVGLETSVDEAERIKREYGIVSEKKGADDLLVEIEMAYGGDRKIVSGSDLYRVINPRVRELFSLVHLPVHQEGLVSSMQTGLVLTGGGSLLRGMRQVAESIFNVPVRIGKPHLTFEGPESLHNPIYATGYGLLVYAIKQKKWKRYASRTGSLSNRIMERMKLWLSDVF